MGRSCNGCTHSGAQGGFWGHYLRAEGSLSSPAFPLSGWEAGMAHLGGAGELKIYVAGVAGGFGVAASRCCGCGTGLTPTCTSYRGVGLSTVWGSNSICLSFQEESGYNIYT